MALTLQVLYLSPFMSLCTNEETEAYRDQTASKECLVGYNSAALVNCTFQASSLCTVYFPFDWAWPYSLAMVNGILTSVLQAEAWKVLEHFCLFFWSSSSWSPTINYEEAQATTWKRQSRNILRTLANSCSWVPSWQPETTADPVSGATVDFAASPVS